MVFFFELIGISVFLYYLISIILWCYLDSDIELWLKERWGKSPGKNKWLMPTHHIAFYGLGKENRYRVFNFAICRNFERKGDLDYGCFEWYWKGIGARISQKSCEIVHFGS